MKRDEGDEWSADEPSGDFADRVMARIAQEAHGAVVKAPPRRARFIAGLAGGAALAASVALALAWHGAGARDHGEAIVADRTQLALGARAIAVLEPGAHVSWKGDDVEQSAGDVFYRVEPGGAFRVHTPAGDVAVLGTCFRVRVDGSERNEDHVNGRDIKAATVGAAITLAAIVSVYEGKVAVSHGKDNVTLTAGESARADGTGVHRGVGSSTAAGASAGADGTIASDSDDPLVAANANLADSVREYKRRLETIEAQKTAAEKQLAEAEKKLAVAANDGQALALKNEYDLSQDDWKEMAAQGKVRAKTPCVTPDSFDYSAKSLQAMGLPPTDAPGIKDALAASAKRQWGAVRPACVQALQGNAAMADKLGPAVCQTLVMDVARNNGEDPDEELRQVAEIHAGMRAMPANAGTVLKMVYALSSESNALQQDLAQSIGPDDAHSFVFNPSDEGCWHNTGWTSGPRPVMPPGTHTVTGTTLPSP